MTILSPREFAALAAWVNDDTPEPPAPALAETSRRIREAEAAAEIGRFYGGRPAPVPDGAAMEGAAMSEAMDMNPELAGAADAVLQGRGADGEEFWAVRRRLAGDHAAFTAWAAKRARGGSWEILADGPIGPQAAIAVRIRPGAPPVTRGVSSTGRAADL